MKNYSFPKSYEKISDEFKVTANGEQIGVYKCRVSAHPLNQEWPGYQRPLYQTEQTSYIMLGSDKEVTLDIEVKKEFENVIVRPLSKNVKANVSDGCVKVTFPGVGQYSVEFDGIHHTLAVFINPEKHFDIDKDSPDVIYFGPGVHTISNKIELLDNQTVFIDEGAVLYGGISAMEKKNITVLGYGIIDNSKMIRDTVDCYLPKDEEWYGTPLFFEKCENIKVEGVTIVDSSCFSIHVDGCKNFDADNVKLIGMWRYNSDGCDMCNCINASIRNSFLRTFDDSIVVKGLVTNMDLPVENITAENCVVWCDWGRALEIGAETCAPYMKNIVFKNCDLIHGAHLMMDIQHGDKALVSDVLFEDIRVEYTGIEHEPVFQSYKDQIYDDPQRGYLPFLFGIMTRVSHWSHDGYAGDIKDIYFKDITVTVDNGKVPPSEITIYNTDNPSVIDNIHFDNVVINGEKVNFEGMNITVGNGVGNVYIDGKKVN